VSTEITTVLSVALTYSPRLAQNRPHEVCRTLQLENLVWLRMPLDSDSTIRRYTNLADRQDGQGVAFIWVKLSGKA